MWKYFNEIIIDICVQWQVANALRIKEGWKKQVVFSTYMYMTWEQCQQIKRKFSFRQKYIRDEVPVSHENPPAALEVIEK